MTKIHMSSKMFTPALTVYFSQQLDQRPFVIQRIRAIEVYKGVDAFLMRHGENVPIGVNGQTLQDCNRLRNDPEHSDEGKSCVADSAKITVD